MISKRRFSLPRLDITGMWVFSTGCLVSYRRPSCLQQTPMAFSGGVDCGHPCAVRRIPVLDAWIARVSREEREALEAVQQAMMEGQQEGRHVSH